MALGVHGLVIEANCLHAALPEAIDDRGDATEGLDAPEAFALDVDDPCEESQQVHQAARQDVNAFGLHRRSPRDRGARCRLQFGIGVHDCA